MKYGSICSGIEAATAAWHPLGWGPQWFAEIEKFPSAVLAHHYPDVPNLGDITKFKEWPDESTIDLLVGGTPCQSFSVAGLRKGLDDPRGNLMLTFGAIAKKYRPQWLVWENVPGVLSSNGGKDFGTFLGMLAEVGYGFAYRILDAQYFGVAQRRRRVFVVARFGDWRGAAAVLFERHSMQGDSAPSREAGQEIAGTLASRTGTGGFPGSDEAMNGYIQPYPVANCLTARTARTARTAKGMNSTLDEGQTPVMAFHKSVSVFDPSQITSKTNRSQPKADLCHTLPATASAPIAFSANLSATQHTSAKNLAPSMGAKNPTAVASEMQVRRLTPTECERLQGFPDGYTQVPHRGKPAADGPRYKALGNSMAVPVMTWIGQRIIEAVRAAA